MHARSLLLFAVFTLFSACVVFAQGNLFSSDYLNGGGTATAADGLPTFDEYVEAMSFDNWLQQQENSDPPTNDGDDDGDDDPTPPTNQGNDDDPGEPADGLPIMGQTPDDTAPQPGVDAQGYLQVDNQQSSFWRPTDFWGSDAGSVRVHREPYGPSPQATIKGKPWSYVWWPYKSCDLSFKRWAVVPRSAVKSATQRAKRCNELSPLEAFDTYVYNKYGVNPHSAAWEAHTDHHNKAPMTRRRSEDDAKKTVLFWIVSESVERLGSVSPFDQLYPPKFQPGGDFSRHTAVINGRPASAEVRVNIVSEFLGQWALQYFVAYDDVRHVEKFKTHTEVPAAFLINGQATQQTYEDRPKDQRADNPKAVRFYQMCKATPDAQSGKFRLEPTDDWYYIKYTLRPGLSEYSWWGHCNGFSAASLRQPMPSKFPIKKTFKCSAGKGLKLLRLKKAQAIDAVPGAIAINDSDYEIIETTATEMSIQAPHFCGVATESWSICDTDIRNSKAGFYTSERSRDFQGNAYMPIGGNAALSDAYLRDIHPQHFFVLLMDFVKERKQGVVCDKVATGSKYNAPVRAFRYKHTFQSDPPEATGASTKRWYNLTLWVDYVPYGNHGQTNYVVNNRYPSAWKRYCARLYLDSKGRIADGEWCSGKVDGVSVDSKKDHPDFVWVPVGNPEGSKSWKDDENVNLSEGKVQAFLEHDEGAIACRAP